MPPWHEQGQRGHSTMRTALLLPPTGPGASRIMQKSALAKRGHTYPPSRTYMGSPVGLPRSVKSSDKFARPDR